MCVLGPLAFPLRRSGVRSRRGRDGFHEALDELVVVVAQVNAVCISCGIKKKKVKTRSCPSDRLTATLTQRMSALVPPREHPVVRRILVQQLPELGVGGVLTVRFAHLRDHLAPRLVPLPVTGFFVQLLDHSLPGGPVFQRKLRDYPAQLVGLGQLDFVQRNAQPQAKLVETVHHAPVDFAEDHDTFSAVGQKLRHP